MKSPCPTSRILLLTCLFILPLVRLCAQQDFRPGYVILTSGDTINGFIEYKGNKANAKKCIFVKEYPSSSPVMVYGPDSLRGYRFPDSKYYVSKHLQINDKDEVLFLEFLVHGKVDLYYYRDDNADEHYFIDKGDGRLLALTSEEKEVYIDGVKYLQESKLYIGVLKYVMQDSPSASKEAENASLTHKSLIKITADYHYSVCKDEQCIIYEKQLPKVHFHLGPVIGANLNFLNRIGTSFPTYHYYFLYGDFNPAIDPTVGICLRLTLPALHDRLSVEDNILLNRFTTLISSVYTDESIGYTSYDDIRCVQYCINNSLLLRYEITAGKVRPVFSLGGFINYAFQSSYTRDHQEILNTGTVLRSYTDNENPFKKLIYGATAGFGVRAKVSPGFEIDADLRYSAGLGIYPNLNTNIFSLSVSMPFRL